MEQALLRVFYRQILLNCQFVMLASEELSDIRENTPRIWYGVQGILTASADISKALWGSGGKAADARAPLRSSLGVDDTSPLRGVAMRNHFEHLDERLDRWWATSKHRTYIDQNLGDVRRALQGALGYEEVDMFRNYDPSTGLLTFWGEEFDLGAIVAEVARIHPIAEREANRWP